MVKTIWTKQMFILNTLITIQEILRAILTMWTAILMFLMTYHTIPMTILIN